LPTFLRLISPAGDMKGTATGRERGCPPPEEDEAWVRS
jgi:hypothetical protein